MLPATVGGARRPADVRPMVVGDSRRSAGMDLRRYSIVDPPCAENYRVSGTGRSMQDEGFAFMPGSARQKFNLVVTSRFS